MYSKLAEYYDELMSGTEYEKWADDIARHLGSRKNGIDLCCGTGKLSIELKKRGFSIVGIDNSVRMLNVALDNCRAAAQDILFVKQDITKLRLGGKVDFFVCACDGVNYIKKTTELFAGIYGYLNDGGVFIFDISSEYKLREVLGNNTFYGESNGLCYVWNNTRNEKSNSIGMELIFFEQDSAGRYIKSSEYQTQYIHAHKKILSDLNAVGFSSVKCYKGYTRKNFSDTDERLKFVAVKGASPLS